MAAAVDRARNLCRRVKRALENWEGARSGQGSVGAVQDLANAAIAAGYLTPGSAAGSELGARWGDGEAKLRARLEVALWEQRMSSQKTLDERLGQMAAAVTELRESLATVSRAEADADNDEPPAFQAVSTGYLRELLAEITGALAEETAFCRRLAAGASALSGHEEREQHLLLSSTWTARPCVPEARLRSLKEALALELVS